MLNRYIFRGGNSWPLYTVFGAHNDNTVVKSLSQRLWRFAFSFSTSSRFCNLIIDDIEMWTAPLSRPCKARSNKRQQGETEITSGADPHFFFLDIDMSSERWLVSISNSYNHGTLAFPLHISVKFVRYLNDAHWLLVIPASHLAATR